MAKFTPGPAIGSISGSIGGTTFSRNRYGLYSRRRSIPVNPQTVYQQKIRNSLSAASSAWRALDPLDQAAWRTWAQNNPIVDALGQSQVLSGNAAYVQLNSRLVFFDAAQIDVPPIAAAPDPPTALALDADIGAGDFEVTFAPTPVPANTGLILRGAVVNSAGINYVKNLRRVLTMLAAAETSPQEIQTVVEDVFGSLAVGQIVHLQAQFVSLRTGLYSAPLSTFAPVIQTS